MSIGGDTEESVADAVRRLGDDLARMRRQRVYHHHSYNTSVVEKRAPTDESVKLLREMEAAALAKIIAATSVGDTTFECVVHAQKDMVSDSDMYRVIFSLNGKKMTVDHTVRDIDRQDGIGGERQVVDALIEKVADKIAVEVLSGALSTIWRDK